MKKYVTYFKNYSDPQWIDFDESVNKHGIETTVIRYVNGCHTYRTIYTGVMTFNHHLLERIKTEYKK